MRVMEKSKTGENGKMETARTRCCGDLWSVFYNSFFSSEWHDSRWLLIIAYTGFFETSLHWFIHEILYYTRAYSYDHKIFCSEKVELNHWWFFPTVDACPCVPFIWLILTSKTPYGGRATCVYIQSITAVLWYVLALYSCFVYSNSFWLPSADAPVF
jgi:hypothetical protein